MEGPHTQHPAGLWFSILGPLTADHDGRALPLGPLKQRQVLAMLLCRANHPVSVGTLTEALWDAAPPRTARKNLQVYVSTLRSILAEAGADDRLSHRNGGYHLRVGADELDTLRFTELARAGREAAGQGSFATAARLLRGALDLWQSPPLAELSCSPVLAAEAERLGARHLQTYEDWAEAELRLGNAAEVAGSVTELAERHPLRERLIAAQMNALYASGRQSEALAVYDALRQRLAAELGLEPSPPLAALYRSILAGDRPGPATDTVVRGRARCLLPGDLPDFTGRERQAAELSVLLAGGRNRLVALTGPVGIGKTTLAVRAAHRLAAHFPDGRLLVRLRDEEGCPRPAEDVLAELTRLAGLPAPAPDRAQEAAAAWREWLTHRRVLLVLDDAPREAAVRPLVPDGGAAAVLVTARSRLAGLAGAHRVDVPPFSRDEALELLGRLIGPGRVAADPASAEHILATAGRVPLAVRAAGLKLAVLRHLPLREFAGRLTDPGSLLDELTAGDVGVRSRVAQSWRDLSDADGAVLRRLGSLPEPVFTLHQATTALECDGATARRRLESLIDAGVLSAPDHEVTSHAALYELPRLTHVYAATSCAHTTSEPSAAPG
ncbi:MULTISPECIES: AfsR/SARP family transcriptional regulator [unclassified Streptomyces]|uniref:AfsR/SARP family transcriptional regulator n=1 Tax=unclassified Streptomyces TaxID=2593676 RepID=UPI0022B62B5F|nr:MULTISPECIES: AfsR/SARP family transcriptional regulator [unclassified Streptomyces]MCZ7416135.1 AfsR/SARP family transcriptional regulator [Streptomyces sp. WMMC897]MCZ7434057.1 AfsR/SARP family transcriptional regulator [Streptomyces sp. WMMC1477]